MSEVAEVYFESGFELETCEEETDHDVYQSVAEAIPCAGKSGVEKTSKKTHACKGEDIELVLVQENGQVLADPQKEQLNEILIDIQQSTKPKGKDAQPLFSIDESELENGRVKLDPNTSFKGKVASPAGYSTIKKRLSTAEQRDFHSKISGYGEKNPDGKATRPRQLMSPEMADALVRRQIAESGGIKTMLTLFDEEILSPIERAYNELPTLFPKSSAEDFSQEFKAYLKLIILAHFADLPNGLAFLTHLYNLVSKLIKDGQSTVRAKTQIKNASNTKDEKKFVAPQLTANEVKTREGYLSKIEQLINRIEKLMKSISFLKAAPKFKAGKLETYWNQDLELTPGVLSFRIFKAPEQQVCLPATESGLFGLSPLQLNDSELLSFMGDETLSLSNWSQSAKGLFSSASRPEEDVLAKISSERPVLAEIIQDEDFSDALDRQFARRGSFYEEDVSCPLCQHSSQFFAQYEN